MRPRIVYLIRTTSKIQCTIELDEPTELYFKATTTNTVNGNWTSLRVQVDKFLGGGEVVSQFDQKDMDHVSMAVKVPTVGKFSVTAISENYHATAESITIEHPQWGKL